MSIARLDRLLDGYRHGTLTEAEQQELGHALLASPAARAAFWQCCVAETPCVSAR